MCLCVKSDLALWWPLPCHTGLHPLCLMSRHTLVQDLAVHLLYALSCESNARVLDNHIRGQIITWIEGETSPFLWKCVENMRIGKSHVRPRFICCWEVIQHMIEQDDLTILNHYFTNCWLKHAYCKTNHFIWQRVRKAKVIWIPLLWARSCTGPAGLTRLDTTPLPSITLGCSTMKIQNIFWKFKQDKSIIVKKWHLFLQKDSLTADKLHWSLRSGNLLVNKIWMEYFWQMHPVYIINTLNDVIKWLSCSW